MPGDGSRLPPRAFAGRHHRHRAEYFALASGAILLTRLSGGIALLWLANAPLIAVLCVTPMRRWAPLLAAAIVGTWSASLCFSPILGAASPLPWSMSARARWPHCCSGAGASTGASSTIPARSRGSCWPRRCSRRPPAGCSVPGWRACCCRSASCRRLFDWIVGHGIGNIIARAAGDADDAPRHRLAPVPRHGAVASKAIGAVALLTTVDLPGLLSERPAAAVPADRACCWSAPSRSSASARRPAS